MMDGKEKVKVEIEETAKPPQVQSKLIEGDTILQILMSKESMKQDAELMKRWRGVADIPSTSSSSAATSTTTTTPVEDEKKPPSYTYWERRPDYAKFLLTDPLDIDSSSDDSDYEQGDHKIVDVYGEDDEDDDEESGGDDDDEDEIEEGEIVECVDDAADVINLSDEKK